MFGRLFVSVALRGKRRAGVDFDTSIYEKLKRRKKFEKIEFSNFVFCLFLFSYFVYCEQQEVHQKIFKRKKELPNTEQFFLLLYTCAKFWKKRRIRKKKLFKFSILLYSHKEKLRGQGKWGWLGTGELKMWVAEWSMLEIKLKFPSFSIREIFL